MFIVQCILRVITDLRSDLPKIFCKGTTFFAYMQELMLFLFYFSDEGQSISERQDDFLKALISRQTVVERP
jgi:hypothetical protein